MKTIIDPLKATHTRNNHKMLTGSTTDKYPVVLDGGKTIIYISDKRKENEIRLKYAMRSQHPVPK
ncbi:MAG: hypothetical protein ACOYMF_05050 [Bacteroidales bacterium]